MTNKKEVTYPGKLAEDCASVSSGAPKGNSNARKGAQRLGGILTARCTEIEETAARDAAERLDISTSAFIRHACAQMAIKAKIDRE